MAKETNLVENKLNENKNDLSPVCSRNGVLEGTRPITGEFGV